VKQQSPAGTKGRKGFWHGDDFTAWFENIVQRSETCDDPTFTPCNLQKKGVAIGDTGWKLAYCF
jgi:hypothetical protein